MVEPASPTVSIIITNFNDGKYIDQAIESALQQDYTDLEIIIINDGSTDDSDAVITRYLDSGDTRIRYHKNGTNEGIVPARNTGLELATGDFLFFLDADDTVPLDYVSTLVNDALSTGADVVYTDLQLFGDASHKISVPEFDFEELKARNIVHMGSLIRRSRIGDHRFDPALSKLSHEDWDFFLGLAFSGATFHKNSQTALNYRIHGSFRNSQLACDEQRYALSYVSTNVYILEKYRKLHPGQIDFTTRSELVRYISDGSRALERVSELEREREDLRYAVSEQQHSLEEQERLINSLSQRFDAILNSRRYRLGRVFAAPLIIARSIRDHGLKATAGVVYRAITPRNHSGTPVVQNVENQQLAYERYVRTHYPSEDSITSMGLTTFTKMPLISVIMPTYNTKESFLREAIESVLCQAYANFELIIVDDASTDPRVRDVIRSYSNRDNRIRFTANEQNLGIAGSTNKGMSMATGEYVSLFDHDDLLWPNALFEVVRAINDHPDANLIYTDEDKVDEDSDHHFEPFFKPDWNPDLLREANYITHLTTIRRSVLEDCGFESTQYDGAQDWELILRVTRSIPRQTIVHISTVVYSWRASTASTAKSVEAKPYVREAQIQTVQDDLDVRGYRDAQVERDDKGLCHVRYALKGNPLISIVIPSKNNFAVVRRCIESILAKSNYENYEIILVDTGSNDPDLLEWYAQLADKEQRFHLHHFVEEKFSYAKSCNYGARQAKGELLVQLNNDTEVISHDWLEVLGGFAQRSGIGAVSPLLFYPGNRLIQHAGVGIGVGSPGASANNLFSGHKRTVSSVIQNVMLNATRDCTAVTAACMMIRRDTFFEIGGFTEEFRVTFNDVDLCLKLWEKGYFNIYTPMVQLTHYESLSIGVPEQDNRDVAELLTADLLFKRRWATYVARDPNYNRNLNRNRSDFTL